MDFMFGFSDELVKLARVKEILRLRKQLSRVKPGSGKEKVLSSKVERLENAQTASMAKRMGLKTNTSRPQA